MNDWNYEIEDIEDIAAVVGKTPTAIWQVDDDEIFMKFSDGYVLEMFHLQTCSESVVVDDVSGDWSDLIGKPLLVADVRVSYDIPRVEGEDDYWTWTFYTFRGNGGSVDVRWYGSSNGNYSERVDTILYAPNDAEKLNLNPPF